jgi:hypothetical protein
MPQVLKSAPDGRIKMARFYTAGQLAVLMGVAHTTATRLIDQGEIRGFWLPTGRRQRRVTHEALVRFVGRNPGFRFVLDRIIGFDPAEGSPGGADPAPPPKVAKLPAPRSPERPRSVRRGKIPNRSHYPLKEVAYVLGIARRTAWTKVRSRELLAIRAPSTGPCTWRWLVPRPCLIAFIERNPSYSYALSRMDGCESAVPASDPTVRPRREPLIPPGAPGWRGHPNQTRRGGFKRGPKLPDGRQPSLTREDIAARDEANRRLSADSPAKR